MSLRILVVDDEPDLELLIRQRFRRQIRENELTFAFAGDGVEALERLADDADIDIVLSDINMPRMDGLSLLDRIRPLDRLLKVIIVSAYGDLQNIRTAMNRGAFDFITKPINFDDLDVTIRKTNDELGVLRKAFEIQKQLSSIQRELEIASKIQLSSLPSAFPAFPDRTDVDLHAMMIPAREVGGDFYDFFLIDDDRIGFVIGDVAGKGVGAALFMAITRTMIRATAMTGASSEECIRHVNRTLRADALPGMFVTVFYGVLHTGTGEVEYVNAGHNPPYIFRADGSAESVERTGGLGLCLQRDFAYRSKSLRLEVGDILLLYTDGVTEASNDEEQRFENEGLTAAGLSARKRTPAEIIRHVLRDISAFSGGADQHDDITLLAVEYRGRGEKDTISDELPQPAATEAVAR